MDLYLSKLLLPSPNHFAVMLGFPPVVSNTPRSEMAVLWRKDGQFTLVQSLAEPVWEKLRDAKRRPIEAASKRFELPQFKEGDRYQYHMAIAPSKRDKVSRSERWVEPTQWLSDRVESLGGAFEVADVSAWRVRTNDSAKRLITFPAATVRGLVTVTNPENFTRSIVYGIGRHRSYGVGLISLY